MKQKVIFKIFKTFLNFTPPIKASPSRQRKGITSKIGHEFIYYYLMAIKSFFYFSKLNISVTIIDDGTLTENDVAYLRTHIKNLNIILARDGNKKISQILAKYPFSKKYRFEKYPNLFKHNTYVFDPIFLPTYQKFMLFDADIIFFNKPEEIISWFQSNNTGSFHMSFSQKHVDTEFRWGRVILLLFSQLWKSPIPPKFNDGITLGFKINYRLDILERYIKKYIYPNDLQKSWISVVLLSAATFKEIVKRNGQESVSCLDEEKYLILTQKNSHERNIFSRVAVHYIASHKQIYFAKDAIRLLLKTRLFRKNLIRN
jgi:hypothetical protein